MYICLTFVEDFGKEFMKKGVKLDLRSSFGSPVCACLQQCMHL